MTSFFIQLLSVIQQLVGSKTLIAGYISPINSSNGYIHLIS